MPNNAEMPLTTNKPLYRRTDDAVLAGVCSGLAEYFKLDTNLIRLIAVTLGLLAFGYIVPMYLVFWLVLPTELNYQDTDSNQVWHRILVGLVLDLLVIPLIFFVIFLSAGPLLQVPFMFF
jgi:phage shock protein C